MVRVERTLSFGWYADSAFEEEGKVRSSRMDWEFSTRSDMLRWSWWSVGWERRWMTVLTMHRHRHAESVAVAHDFLTLSPMTLIICAGNITGRIGFNIESRRVNSVKQGILRLRFLIPSRLPRLEAS